jgi:hypothetical protein
MSFKVSDVKIILNDGLENIWKELIVASVEVPSRHLRAYRVANSARNVRLKLMFGLRFKPGQGTTTHNADEKSILD